MDKKSNFFTWILDRIKPPVFVDDDEKTRLAGLLNIVTLFYIGMLLLIALIVPMLGNNNFLVTYASLMILMVPTVASAVLLRQGSIRLSGWIFSAVIWALTIGLMAISGGVQSSMLHNLIPILIIVGLIMGGRVLIGFALLSVTAVFILGYIDYSDIVLPVIIGESLSTTLMVSAFNYFEATAMLYLASDSITKALNRARSNEKELAERNEQLQTTVEQYVDFMAGVARGDLASRLPMNSNGQGAHDPLILLGLRLNDTIASLQKMITQTREAATNLTAAAAEILAATTQQLSSSNEQSASISQTTTTVDEIKVIAEQTVARAQEVADSSLQTVEVSKTGNQSVQKTVASMSRIKQRVESIAENILALTEQTQQIGEIISTVSDIAAQSNMLSLNASVEAARAGEHGKGFAIVASEVRGLATQSKQAAAQVRAILSDIQDATNAAVMATEEGAKQVEEGVVLATQTGASIEQLWRVIDESSQTALQLVAGGRQQAAGMEQIAQAMANINQATLQSLSSTRQAETTAQNLNGLAANLSETVELYQL